ncbi:MAG TPA: 2OG-Fe(II) oxygenase [Steroidobacteraceae bacterium]|jgi:SM-20-related protein|nr:2OG-Fe(II) oxygenase [Steroidobacteraceae bacterium]
MRRSEKMIDLLEVPDFLGAEACAALRAEMRAAGGRPATVSGGNYTPEVRRTTHAAVPSATSEGVIRLLMARKDAIERHFGLRLTDCEDPHFLHYNAGDFFVAHEDGSTGGATRYRKISAVIFLSAQSDEPLPDTYGGGSLVLHGPASGPPLRVPLAPAPGTLVAFRAETTHEVTPVTHGERFTIVSWYRAGNGTGGHSRRRGRLRPP